MADLYYCDIKKDVAIDTPSDRHNHQPLNFPTNVQYLTVLAGAVVPSQDETVTLVESITTQTNTITFLITALKCTVTFARYYYKANHNVFLT